MHNKNYSLLIGYQNEDKLRASFNDLALQTFNLSFEGWYQSGYWKEKYIPYTLFYGEKAIANVSVNIIDFNVFGQQKRYIQLGTIMTDQAYRNKNHSRFLMDKVMEEWQSQCDLIYLFANSTVLAFYPRFGFERVKEYAYYKRIGKNINNKNYEKLNMDEQSNRDKLYDYAKNTKVFGKLSMQENADLVLFYCITLMKDCVFYIKSLDVIVVAIISDRELHLLDIFGKNTVELDRIVASLSHTDAEILLGFTPQDVSSYMIKEIISDDALFIQKDRTDLFERNKVMFPLLSHA